MLLVLVAPNTKCIIRRYCVIIYVGHFWPLYKCPIYVRSLCYISKFQIFYIEIPAFYADIFLFVFGCAGHVHVRILVFYLWYVLNDSVPLMCQQGGRVEASWWQKHLHDCARKIIMARNLLCRVETQYQVPVRILFPQGAGRGSCTDHVVVRPCDLD